ncbi:PREDICTED: uncharacterized protein LOC109353961 [Lupinus angustifolius]|uniref:uncharacterized protein LOC109353961 n=1 Tax=Lupinus angustifolius TaxID=3871 RepID=UPI00092F3A30|nr:PREDICTED: uncharacterized protein LOC109353961 [Lupinus angustifolius]
MRHNSEASNTLQHHSYDHEHESDANASLLHVSNQTHQHTHYHYHVTIPKVNNHCGTTTLSHKPTVRIFTKADTNYSLTIRDHKVVLALSNPNDDYQHWYKIEKYGSIVKDEEGCQAFSLVNKVTGQAIKHTEGGTSTHPVCLVPYNPCKFDDSILWTESLECYDGYRAIRVVNNIQLNVDAFGGGEVHDGTPVILWDWNNGDHQKWKILPYCK